MVNYEMGYTATWNNSGFGRSGLFNLPTCSMRKEKKNLFYSKEDYRRKSCTAANEMYFEDIDKRLRFKNLESFPIMKYDDYLQIAIDDINLIVIGENKQRISDDFKDEISHLWNYYAKEEDSKLTDGAKKIKRWLQNHLEER